jgi:glycosyltransferase involved in cell wall biosynthesis
MSVGLVCIGNDTTGINEIIEDGVTGYLSPSASENDIVGTIRRAQAGDSERVVSAATQFIRSTFSLDAVIAQEREVFAAICPKIR